ncbi:MAG: mechanosensitive ion channel family protein [Microthrixaceae bacterium]
MWFTPADATDGERLVAALLHIGVIVVLAVVLRWLIQRILSSFLGRMSVRLAATTRANGSRHEVGQRLDARTGAVAAMGRSLVTWVVVVVAALMILDRLDVNVAPLLAGAGIVGIAVGFGAQSLVRDVLAGVFIVLEDQFGVGDVIDAGPATGTVERITLRSTQLRDQAGTVWHIPNGSIQRVGNKTQHWARAVVEVVVAHSADLRAARAAMGEVAQAMVAEPRWAEAMRLDRDVDEQGVSQMGPTGITLRIVVDTEPRSQWAVERELRFRIKEAFDEGGIPLAGGT